MNNFYNFCYDLIKLGLVVKPSTIFLLNNFIVFKSENVTKNFSFHQSKFLTISSVIFFASANNIKVLSL